MRPVSARRWRSLRFRAPLAAGLAVALGLLSWAGLSAGLFRGYRLQAADAYHPSGPTDPRVRVVAIDRRSIEGMPQERWPWGRDVQADLVRRLVDLGADTVVLDIVFPTESDDEAEDEALARAVGSGPVVLATLSEPEVGRDLYSASVVPPIERLARRASGLGHTSVIPDPDGVVRSLPLLVETEEGQLHPSLALAAFVRATGENPVFTLRPDGVQIGARFIPTGRLKSLDISFTDRLDANAEGAPISSAVDVLRGRVPRADVEGKIVLVGVTDPSLGDDRPTPVAKANEMPGVLIHANALNMMLTEHYVQPVGEGRIAVEAALVALVVALFTLLGPVWLGPVGLLLSAGGFAVWTDLQFDAGRVHDRLYPLLAAVLAFVASLGFRYVTELRGRRRAASLFSQYVPKSVAYQLLDQGRVDDTIRGERVELTVLFCDLRGFTAQSVQMEPVQVRDMLNIYYDETSRLVHEYEGTLLNYVGDEVFAVWGAPVPDPDHAKKAVACARAFQDDAANINERLAAAGLPSVAYGIGLHTGDVIAAHVGTEMRRQYTVLGDTVNCGSRLCTVAGRTEIVVSDDTYQRLDPQPPSEVLPGFRLKGVGRELLPHRLWPDELRDPTGQTRGKLEG